MKEPSQPEPGLTAEQRETVVREWLAQTLRTYPEQTSRFLFDNRDPFKNPVGHAIRDGLPVLVEELCGAFRTDRMQSALNEIVRIRAVQDFTASQAIGFIFFLKQIFRAVPGVEPASLSTLDERIDRLALLAFDNYMRSREKTWEIKLNESKRRVYVPERIASERARS